LLLLPWLHKTLPLPQLLLLLYAAGATATDHALGGVALLLLLPQWPAWGVKGGTGGSAAAAGAAAGVAKAQVSSVCFVSDRHRQRRALGLVLLALQASASLLLRAAASAAAVRHVSCHDAPVGLSGKLSVCCKGVPNSIGKGSCGSICCSAGVAAPRCCCSSTQATGRRCMMPDGLMLREPLMLTAPATMDRSVSLAG
jgi:hypothetical protein